MVRHVECTRVLHAFQTFHRTRKIDQVSRPVALRGDYARDEAEQATYLRELLDVFATEGVDAAFVYTFARYDLPHRGDAHADLDVVSCGVVKVLEGMASAPLQRRYPGMLWEPKAAFDVVAQCYGR